MTFRKKTVGFQQKKIGRRKEYNSFGSLIDRGFVSKTVGIIANFFLMIFCFSKIFGSAGNALATVTKETVKLVSRTTGESMTKDTLGNINVMLVGYAGEDERGGLLTDTIMVASYNPSLGTVTFLSIPRDMYVTYHKGGRGRLNGAYRAKYIDTDNNHELAADFLMEKISEITGIHLQYYAFVSFDGFVEYIDSIDGIQIDVPEDLVDPYYPDDNNGFDTFAISKGLQTIDGDTALKYARSRKTTSDFSRTIRQQQIIKAIADKVIAGLSITDVGQVRQMYSDAMDMIRTNITVREIVGLIKYVEDEKRFFSFVYTADCDKRYYELTFPGCVLFLGNREDYEGQSVLLPIGATPGNINYYKHTKEFAFWVVHNQEFLLENAPIKVLNGIDEDRAKSQNLPVEGVATRLAIELKAQAFNIADIANHDQDIEKSIAYVQDKEAYRHTLDLLEIFVDIDEVRDYGTGALSEGVSLILGNDYLLKQ